MSVKRRHERRSSRLLTYPFKPLLQYQIGLYAEIQLPYIMYEALDWLHALSTSTLFATYCLGSLPPISRRSVLGEWQRAKR